MMTSNPDFQESAAALENLVARRRRETRIAHVLQPVVDAFRVLVGLSRDYNSLNTIRDRVADVMTPYLAGELLPEDRARVDALLAAEPLCREMAAPLIAAWSMPRGREEMPAEEVDAAWSRFQREIGARRPRRGEDV